MIGVDDLRKPQRASGFKYVTHLKGERPPHSSGYSPHRQDKYRAHRKTSTGDWYGPCRLTAVEAAADACVYLNGLSTVASSVLKVAGHEYEINPASRDEEELAALGVLRDKRAQRAGQQGYVYLIVEDVPGCCYGKVGYSVNPKKRVAELQTGNPRKLKLHATKKAVEADEKALHAKYIKHNKLQEWFTLTPALLAEFGGKK